MKLDPVVFEILRNKVTAAADEMSVNLQRASRSAYVKEAADFCTALVDRDGLIFGYPPSAGTTFIIDCDCTPTILAVPDLEEGDVIITNDPYRSQGLSTHLPDIHMLQPYFHRGKIVAYGWCFIHFTDVGGKVPSSISPSSHELFQEGLIIPPMKVVDKNGLNEDLLGFIKANCRTADVNMGDIRAMLGSLITGRQRIAELIADYGVETFHACQKDLLDYSADKARAVLRRIPDGSYDFWDFMDDDMVTRIPLRVRIRLTAKDGLINLDVTGTDPQVDAAYNVPTMGGRNYWLTMRLTTFIGTHDPFIEPNAGVYRHITATNPPETLLNAQFPDAVGIRAAPSRRLNDAMTGALLKAVPDQMAAPTCGSSGAVVYSELDARTGQPKVTVLEPTRGGMGAGMGFDGVDARDASMSNLRNHPVEHIEDEFGVIIREYDVRTDSGGPGRWRGGVGQFITVEILSDSAVILCRGMERLRFPSWGVFGARPAAPFTGTFNKGQSSERKLTKIDELHVRRGDTVSLYMPGGSGYGDPYLRDPERVRTDVELGFVTRQGGERDYGVVLRPDGSVDAAKSRRLRATRVKDNVRADFDFGPEREAWEAVFDDATMGDLNNRLYKLPKSIRQASRRRIFDHAVPDLPIAGDGTSLAKLMADPDAIRARLADVIAEVFGGAAGD